jgi:hypothetical protein
VNSTVAGLSLVVALIVAGCGTREAGSAARSDARVMRAVDGCPELERRRPQPITRADTQVGPLTMFNIGALAARAAFADYAEPQQVPLVLGIEEGFSARIRVPDGDRADVGLLPAPGPPGAGPVDAARFASRVFELRVAGCPLIGERRGGRAARTRTVTAALLIRQARCVRLEVVVEGRGRSTRQAVDPAFQVRRCGE